LATNDGHKLDAPNDDYKIVIEKLEKALADFKEHAERLSQIIIHSTRHITEMFV
jgi:hypothetical protein